MTEMQLGLAMAAPTILAFIAFMYRTGAIPPAGAIAATLMTLIITAVLYIEQ
jgi:hypothetical protein